MLGLRITEILGRKEFEYWRRNEEEEHRGNTAWMEGRKKNT